MVADWRAAATAQMVDGLVAQSDAGTRDHWTRYLKGRAVFRGVPMAGVRRVVRTVWAERALDQHGPDAVLELALSWFGAEATEDKLAGVLLIAEHLAPRLADRHATALGAPLARGDLADWNVVDWYATKAVHAFLTARPDRIAARSVRVHPELSAEGRRMASARLRRGPYRRR
ncbi:MAG: hypothetical protein EBU70_12520 [Actinobacteria bacterium]|nr:hypothetical protein [Actinomycetota bacterium]